MQWGAQQNKALSQVSAWLKNPGDKQVFRLFGYAGTGKTTLAKHFAEGISRVAFGAYTGKAALVLRQKGCMNAATLHSMIYLPSPKSEADIAEMREQLFNLKISLQEPEGLMLTDEEVACHQRVKFLQEQIEDENARLQQPRFTLNRNSDVKSCDLIIIDEVTMVDTRMGEDLLSFGVPVLVLGDPGQLPPVGGSGYFTKQKPDILLTEIHRQAQDNPILQLATMAREKKELPLGRYGSSEVITMSELKERTQQVTELDMILCGRNKTRRTTNQRLRELAGIQDMYPVAGERLVCLKNSAQEGLLNGGLWEVSSVESHSDDLRRHMSINSIDEPMKTDVEALSMIFRGEDTNKVDYFTIASAAWFDYGSCLTVHKCVSPDTIIETDKGLREIGTADLKGTVSTGFGQKTYEGKFFYEDRPALKLTTSDRYSITVTQDHKCEVIRDGVPAMIPADEVAVGDYVRMRVGTENPSGVSWIPNKPAADVRAKDYKIPTEMTKELAEFLGLMVADGTIFKSGFRLAKRYLSVVERFEWLTQHLFEAAPKRIEITGTPGAEVSSTLLVTWLKLIGGMNPKEKDVPSCILSATLEHQQAFLKGLFEDGGVNIGMGKECVQFFSSMPNVVRKVQRMLLRSGIVCTSAPNRPESLFIYSEYAEQFRKVIRFVADEKNESLDSLYFSSPKRFFIPVPKDRLHAIPITETTRRIRNNALTSNGLSRAGMRRLSDSGHWDSNEEFWHYTKIVSIESVRSDVVCLEVPEGNRFLQNGFPWGNSQGSQFETGLVIDESKCFRGYESNHLYTGLTRFSEAVLVAS